MRKSNTERMGGVVLSVLRELKLEDKLKEVRLMRSWEKVLGRALAGGVVSMYIRNRVLFVRMRSSVARSELMMRREEVVRALNREAGGSVIDELVIK